MSRQCNLHQHSEGSHLDGYAKVDEIATRAKELGQDAAAITDHGECNQHLAFQKACNEHGVKSVLGIESYWHHDIAAARAAKKYPKDLSHICLLAKDQRGLENLWAMSSIAYDAKHFYHRPMLDPALMREHSEGVFASDGCMMTGLGRAVEAGDDEAARRFVATLLDIFGDNFYVELHTWQYIDAQTTEQRRLNALMTDINQAKVRIANELGVPLVVVNDSHHARPEDWVNKELMWQLGTKKNNDQQDYGQKADHLMGDDELYYWMRRHGVADDVVAEAIKNSHDIAMSCTAEVKPSLELPTYSGSDHDDIAAFISLIESGFKSKVIDAGLDAEAYYQRMETEAQLIVERSYAGYFLVVQDYVRAAHDGSWKHYVDPGAPSHPMITGPSRGSAGGCLISYLLGITTVDPIRYGLIFERFMNPARKSMPDIDVDFPQSLRPDLKGYLEARWGADHVCTLGTVSRNGPKGMLKDLARKYKEWSGTGQDIPHADIEAMSKIVEQAAALVAAEREAAGEVVGDDDDVDDMSWDEVLSEKGGDLAPWAKRYPPLFEKLGEMIGLARQSGVHPSGILINGTPLQGLVPMRRRNEVTTTQFDMWDIEALGGCKFDLLGIRHLDTLDHARRLIHERHGVMLDFSTFGDEQMSDPAIWDQIDRGQTTGIFQVESPLASKTAEVLKPRNEVDVAALISIIRPGVKDAGLMDEYLLRRAGQTPVIYDHPLMEPITDETYGVLVYQEQLMFAAQSLAGFTGAEADDLRKALGKKLQEQIDGTADKFRQGCLNNPAFMDPLGGDDKKASKVITKIWASINASGRYAFNKSHAVGYAVLSTWEVWVKHYYPQEYLVALMATDAKQLTRYIREARRRGIKVLPPDINKSGQKFTIDGDAIRYGIDSIRSVGNAAVKAILKTRPYTDFTDYLNRATGWAVNKTVVRNLISIGAFDSIEYDPARDGDWVPGCRSRLMQQHNDYRLWMDVAEGKRAKMDDQQRADHIAMLYAKRLEQKGRKWFDAEFGVPDFSNPDVVFGIEQELAGNFILVDPMEPYIPAIEAVAIKDPSDIDSYTTGDIVIVGGQVSKVKRHIVKNGRSKGQEMAFIGITYNGADFDVTIFNDTWVGVKSLVKEGVPVACTCIRDSRGVHLASLERLDLLFAQAS
ncbi:DNA polymerase III subunit alpha [Mycolicibacter kumamotonensis]|uniref:DNA-directed DNA polymerase n=1 Tax=Mycolicibacter kumamotonensis TaxID=354243 RepID=A0A1B8SLB3_9MYCO|nr:DNA polymerase III subunit alpha [Mycolicibacter kumamotonensis]OBY33494.1 hypothetical protein ACT18_00680 [Mycolicibacter kumamotonensis]